VNPDEDGVIVDACTLQNFSAVGRLDILERHFAHSARWTPAIQWEAGRLRVPSIDWIGTPLPIGGDVATLLAVQLIRGGLGATQTDPATLHLGEAEAIHFIEIHQPTWTFVSDDRPAVDFALRRGLSAIDTQTVLADCYAKGEIGCPDAFELLCQMAAEGRGVQVPPSHWYVCPPGDQSADPALRPHAERAQSRAAPGQQTREPHPPPCPEQQDLDWRRWPDRLLADRPDRRECVRYSSRGLMTLRKQRNRSWNSRTPIICSYSARVSVLCLLAVGLATTRLCGWLTGGPGW
jgi:predicted nucleic acid-binding protein